MYAYCLMDNHIHLLVNEGNDEIARIMKRINVSYAYYFNKKYQRVGHLFQDRFKSEAIEDDTYLLAAVRYLHNNPVKAGMVNYPGEYKWSSYNLYVNDADFRDIIEEQFILGMFSEDKQKAVKLFIDYSQQGHEDSFLEYQEKAKDDKAIQSEQNAIKFIADYLQEKNLGIDDLRFARNVQIRNDLIVELKGRTRLSVRQIAGVLGIGRNIVQRTT